MNRHQNNNRYRNVLNALFPQDCEDLLSITPPQSVKIQRYIEHLETDGITRVKMYMIITTAYLIFWAPLFMVSIEYLL